MRYSTLLEIELIKILRKLHFLLLALFWIYILISTYGYYTVQEIKFEKKRINAPDIEILANAELEHVFPNAAIFFGLLVLISTGREFAQGTLKKNITDGLTRKEYLAGKYFLIPSLAVVFFILELLRHILVARVFLSADLGSSLTVFTPMNSIGFLIVIIFFGLMGLTFAVTVKGYTLAIALYLLYNYAETIISAFDQYLWQQGIYKYLPGNSYFYYLLGNGEMNPSSILLLTAYFCLFLYLPTIRFFRKDL